MRWRTNERRGGALAIRRLHLLHYTLQQTLRAVEERREAAEALSHQASHDTLTDLPNRTAFGAALAAALAEPAPKLAMLFLDLDNFKAINDGLGHAAGDAVLVVIAQRLRAALRPGDVAARFGGDEFMLLLRDVTDADTARSRAASVLKAVCPSLTLDGRTVALAVSVGVALGASDTDAETLLRQADLALHAAKASGKARVLVYTPALGEKAAQRIADAADLRRAITRGELRLHYQPIASTVTGTIVGFEALVRWEHPERGLIMPEAFIPLAEESGLVVPLGRWGLGAACAQLRHWQHCYPDSLSLRVSVNLSPHELFETDFVATVARILAANDVPATSVILELTERGVIEDAEVAIAVLDALRALGIGLALDDFGIGFSVLGYLQRLPVDHVKIDRSFVAGITEGVQAREIVQAVVGLAHTLGLAVVAEGVEREEQRIALHLMGCDLIQGYYLSPPLPPEEAATLIMSEDQAWLGHNDPKTTLRYVHMSKEYARKAMEATSL